MKEQKELGLNDSRAIPNGIGGIEHRMDLMYQGVVTGRISLQRWVELTSTTPALMFGLYGKKGVIQPGADADLVIYDPAGHTSIGYEKTHHMNMDYSAWEGFEIDGHVDWVMSRGTVLINDSGFVGTKGHGQYLKRDLTLRQMVFREVDLAHASGSEAAHQLVLAEHEAFVLAGQQLLGLPLGENADFNHERGELVSIVREPLAVGGGQRAEDLRQLVFFHQLASPQQVEKVVGRHASKPQGAQVAASIARPSSAGRGAGSWFRVAIARCRTTPEPRWESLFIGRP